MKITHLFASLLVACASCVGAADLSLATTPFGTNAQAMPNVVFGLDDSGSMDAEVMLATNDGALWHNNTAR